MRNDWVHALRSRLPQIRARWEALLHVEPVNTPLAYPDALVHLLDWTLEQIFDGLANQTVALDSDRRPTCANYRHVCACGRNPLLTYFTAGEQAMREALVLTQAAAPALTALDRDRSLLALDSVFRNIARREIESFCGVCQYRDGGCPAEAAALRALH
jgi:hypothetical protein